MPSEIERKLAELGAVINPPETAKLYAPLQETEPYQGIKVTRDLKYGTDERHALDVFAPEQASAVPRAVLIYVHGGAFTAGNKRAPGSPFYDNIAAVCRPQRLHRRQHHLPAGAAAPVAGGGGGCRRGGALGGRQHRRARRRSRARVPDGAFGRRRACGELCRPHQVPRAQGHRPHRSDPRLRHLRFQQVSDRGRRRRPTSARTRPSAPEASTLALLPETRIRLMVVLASSIRPNFIEQAKLAERRAVQSQPLLEPAAPAQAHPHVRGLRHQHQGPRAERRDRGVREGRCSVGWCRASAMTQHNFALCTLMVLGLRFA